MGWFQEAKAWKESDPSVTYRQISQKFGIAKQTVKNRFCAERKRNQGTKFPSADELIEQEKAKLQRQHEQRVLQQLVKERGRTELMCDAVREAIAVLPPFPIPEFKPIDSEYDDEDAVLLISDCQIGQVVDPEETGGLGEYNLEVFKQRRRALTKSVRKIVKIHSNAYNVRRLFVPFLGDIVENDIIFRGQKDYVDADVVSQVFVAADEFCSMLTELVQDFEEIHVIGIGGNHGRTGRKGENRTWVNWDYIAYKFMEERLRNQARIKFYIPKSWWTLLEVRGHSFLLLHGDDIRAWNSLPYYGIDRADARWTKMLQVNQLSYEYMLIGHHHNSATIDSPVGEKIVNGCWPGGSQYSLKQLNTSSKPSQWFFGVHERRGISWRYKIDLVAGPYGGG